MARFVTRRARLVMVVWILLVAVFAVRGSGVERELTIHSATIGGTQSQREHDIALREFGSEYAVVVMLRGPQGALERQGRRLAEGLGRVPHILVVSPWSSGAAVDDLRPEPGVATLIVRAYDVDGEDVEDLLDPVEGQLDRTVSGSVHASIAGLPAGVKAVRNATERAAVIGEAIAVPVLLFVLLLVFRSVLAALVPVVVGGAVVAATRGVLSLLAGFVDIDLLTLVAVGMFGLALGVDYSLLVVSRFREELKKEDDLARAVRMTIKATSRSILPAGTGLVFAMVAAALILPGAGASSLAIGVTVATGFSMISALCVVPAWLVVLGGNLDRWSLPPRRGSQVMPLRWSRRLASRPQAVIATVVVLLFLAGWAFTLNSGPSSIAFLPAGDSSRIQQEDVEKTLGPGWLAPIEIVMDGRGAPITSPARLSALVAFQRRLERDPGVESVAGLAGIERGARKLQGLERGLIAQERGLTRLDNGISRLGAGAALNTAGLLRAAAGARQLDSGIGTAGGGAGLLASSLQAAGAGSERLAEGLGRVSEGSGALSQGASKASNGAGRLADAIERAEEGSDEIQGTARLLENAMQSGDDRLAELHSPLRAGGEQLGAAWRALEAMTSGRSDPQYAAVVHAIEEASRKLTGTDIRTGEQIDPSVEDGVERAEGQFEVGGYLSSELSENAGKAEKGIKQLSDASDRLDKGLGRLAAASGRLSDGVAELTSGGEKFSPALMRLGEGAERLVGGLGRLSDGAGLLAAGLGGGAQKSKLLTGGLNRIDTGLDRQADAAGGASSLSSLRETSPGLFHSGYLVLAALDGTPQERRNQLNSLINLDRGGQDARMLVITSDTSNTSAARQTKDRLEADAEALSRKTGTEVVVGGVGPTQIDTNDAIRESAPLIRLVLSLISFIVLIPVVRSLTIPLLSAVLNLLTVSASFGVLSLLFNDSLLGGPGYVETSLIPMTMMIMFALAIDYEVFIFARIREEYVRTGSPGAAVTNGLDHTAHVVTGAAGIMIAVFLAFSISDFILVRNFGVAQAIGVFIDAFIVRLVIIPPLMAWLGKRAWWMPRWLDRVLPGKAFVPGEASGQGRPEPRPAD